MNNNVKKVILNRLSGRVSNGRDGAYPFIDRKAFFVATCYIDKKEGLAYDLNSDEVYAMFLEGEIINQNLLASININDYVVTKTSELDLSKMTTQERKVTERKYKKLILKIKTYQLIDKLTAYDTKKYIK